MTRPRSSPVRAVAAFIGLPMLTALAITGLYRSTAYGEHGDALVCLIMSGSALAALWLGQPAAVRVLERLARPGAPDRRTAVIALAVAACASYLVIARLVLDGFVNSGDEIAYVLQAQTYARGRLWADLPAVADAFHQCRFFDAGGMWISQYPPGWAILLAPFAAIGAPLWIVNPVLGAITLAVFYALARHYVAVVPAWLGTLVLGSSAFFALNSASYFNHSLAALAGIAFALFGVRFLEHGRARDAVLAGLCIGLLGVTRTQNAVLFAVPFIAAMLRSPDRRRGLLWFGIGGTPFLAGLLGYNAAITGHPLTMVQNWHKTETFAAPGAETFRLAANRLARLLTWTSPLLLLAYAAALPVGLRKGRLSFADWIFPLTGLLFLVYGGDGGNQYGPRYYYEAWPLALLTMVKAAAPLLTPELMAPRARVRQAWTASAVLVVLTMQLGYLVPRLQREARVVAERQTLFHAAEAAGLSHAIVLIDRPIGRTRPLLPQDLLRNGLDPAARGVIYALDLGNRREALVRAYPGRRLYALGLQGSGSGPNQAAILQIPPDAVPAGWRTDANAGERLKPNCP